MYTRPPAAAKSGRQTHAQFAKVGWGETSFDQVFFDRHQNFGRLRIQVEALDVLLCHAPAVEKVDKRGKAMLDLVALPRRQRLTAII